jgi:hypothetical protein
MAVMKTEVQEEVDLNGVDPIVMRLHAPDRTEGYILAILLQSIYRISIGNK